MQNIYSHMKFHEGLLSTWHQWNANPAWAYRLNFHVTGICKVNNHSEVTVGLHCSVKKNNSDLYFELLTLSFYQRYIFILTVPHKENCIIVTDLLQVSVGFARCKWTVKSFSTEGYCPARAPVFFIWLGFFTSACELLGKFVWFMDLAEKFRMFDVFNRLVLV